MTTDSLPGLPPAPGSLPDEDAFTVPEAWHPHLHPRRGALRGPVPEPDPAAAAALREREAAMGEQVRRALGHSSSVMKFANAARTHREGTPHPLGAAVVAAVAMSADREVLPLVADAWAVEHGLPFAAEATAELFGLHVTGRDGVKHAEQRRVLELRWWEPALAYRRQAEQVARRTRALLAAADEERYRQAEAALERLHRHGTDHQRVAACYLVPTRHDWVDALLSGYLSDDRARESVMLSASLGTLDHIDAIRGSEAHLGAWRQLKRAAPTVAEAIGPAVAPALIEVYDQEYPREGGTDTRPLLSVLAAVPTDEAFEALAARLDRAHVPAAVQEALERFPRRGLRVLAKAAAAGSHRAALAAQLLRAHLDAHPELADGAPALPAPPGGAAVPEAPAEALPPLLVRPPWTRARKARPKPVVVPGLTAPAERYVAWAAGEREEWLATRIGFWNEPDDWASTIGQLESGRLRGYQATAVACSAPEELVRPLLSRLTADGWWYDNAALRVAARFELDALPFALRLATSDPAAHGRVLLPFFDAEVAAAMADWLARLKNAGRTARAWFRRHPGPAARALLPAALGKAGKERRAAENALRHLAHTGHAEAVTEAAEPHGEQAARAVAALLAQDPLDELPAKIPTAADDVDCLVLPPVLLKDRRHALPGTAVRHLVTMLAMSRRGEVYPGVQVVKEHCDPASLDAFAWSLFQQVGRVDWILPALGAVGGDETARRLTPLIRSWPGEGAHAKAVDGLDTLLAIGSDVALVQLNGIAQKVKFKGVRTRAQERIAALAADLGLTPDQLADRLVPDFGLDRDGSLVLDYGPRSFTAGFDEQLKPYVVDGGGKRLKNLPKPGAKDDPDLAPAAHARFAALKKDVRTVAADQIRRFEQAMAHRRRWSLPEFRTYIAEHPLLWHIAGRLVWTTDAGVSFRIAEDRTLADVEDDTLALPEDAHVSIAHPLHLRDTVDAWAEVFADYEILQPFPQLGRPVFTLTEEEAASPELARFKGVTVPVGKVLGLEKHGWQRADAMDNGCEFVINRPLPGGRWLVLDLDPGITVGMIDETPEQTLGAARLDTRPGCYWHDNTARPAPFGELDDVTASEILAELTALTARPA
ncbi:hypothetical protein GCM10027168_17150 [Streptomyces capparidis]